jgi:hypothetical protein
MVKRECISSWHYLFDYSYCLVYSMPFFYRLCGLVVWVPGYRSTGPRFDFWSYQNIWEVVGLELGPLSLMKIIEELLEWKSSGSCLENGINGHMNLLRWPRNTLYLQKLALTLPTSGGRSVVMVRLRTKSHRVCFCLCLFFINNNLYNCSCNCICHSCNSNCIVFIVCSVSFIVCMLCFVQVVCYFV